MWNTLPEFGLVVLCGILVAAGYTLAVALAAGSGRPRLLQAARMGAYGTVAMVGLAVLVLSYAFVTHDFRLHYVTSHSDRTMSTKWLLVALWGGQDGSLLWWLFLTAAFCAGCVAWLKGRYRELQPYVIATQMSILIFLAILMLFATNPFRALPNGAPPDGEGLNHQLRNIYMIIHPPSLYTGFTSCAVPFSFAIAALATGRLDNEWIVATRKWMLFSWLFLAIGNALGMAWAYEELGWGGYWAWDPVENAAFLPFLTASAYVHSVMIQERRGMLKVWNVILICLTFFMTYFGTFLTRSGLISSVHSFAQNDILGWYFLGYMIAIIVAVVGLMIWRWSKLQSTGTMDSLLSREFAFMVNNWILLFIMLFIAIATMWPRISMWIFDKHATVGPPFYNTFLPPVALLLIFLMGTAPLLGWRKTSNELLLKSFAVPVAAGLIAVTLHFAFGRRLGFPPTVAAERLYGGAVGTGIAWFKGKLPVVTVGLVAYNLAVVVQEFYRGVRARREGKGEREGVFVALLRLVSKARRRYGGYIVHAGIAVMFFGFVGRNWEEVKEATLGPGEQITIGEYELTYKGTRMVVDEDGSKTSSVGTRMVLTDFAVERNGKVVRACENGADCLTPARFIYTAKGTQMRSQIDRYWSMRDDLYVSLGNANPQTKLASFKFHVNTMVSFVWLGVFILILGALVAMWPELSFQEAGAFAYVRALGAAGTLVMLSIMLALAPSQAWAASAQQQQDMERVGVVEQTPEERALFKRMLCDCGDCPHEPLETCTCPVAHRMREWARSELAAGVTPDDIVAKYSELHGSDAVIVQADKGANRVLFLLPVGLGIVGAALLYRISRRWTLSTAAAAAAAPVESGPRDRYDDKLDAELKDLE
jgi:cytochrome c-type biogenesis protein CcmF